MGEYVAAFESTHGAIATRKALEGLVPFRTIPVPRSISAACGIAIKFSEEHLEIVVSKLESLDMEGEYSVHKM